MFFLTAKPPFHLACTLTAEDASLRYFPGYLWVMTLHHLLLGCYTCFLDVITIRKQTTLLVCECSLHARLQWRHILSYYKIVVVAILWLTNKPPNIILNIDRIDRNIVPCMQHSRSHISPTVSIKILLLFSPSFCLSISRKSPWWPPDFRSNSFYGCSAI